MLEITCPWCGKRAQTEFSYEGDATVSRPDTGDEKAFFDYVYLRDNPRGWHDELWQHTAGCRRFVKVRRHVTTHEIAATAKPGDALPALEETER
jgi:heterotetrameric sarcosine oxidase delta subunit